MRRIFVVLAAVGLVAGGVVNAAQTATASGNAALRLGTYYCPNGPSGASVTYSGTLIVTTQQFPDGIAHVIASQELFTIYCQPRSGSVTLDLQRKTPSGWINADSARFDFPTTVRGFSLTPARYYCQGSNTYWRLAINSSGKAADGSPWGPETDWDPAVGGSTGKKLDCR